MTTTEQKQPGQETLSSKPEAETLELSPAELNCQSLLNILDEITGRLNFQILGNCDTLLHMETKTARGDRLVKSDSGETQTLRAFQEHQINTLIRAPLRHALGRLSGLRKVLINLQSQVSKK